jgi:hypothetical protein
VVDGDANAVGAELIECTGRELVGRVLAQLERDPALVGSSDEIAEAIGQGRLGRDGHGEEGVRREHPHVAELRDQGDELQIDEPSVLRGLDQPALR